ncbi:MAG: amidohydrolase family protein, partial [Trueperaceae bacterium]
PDLQEFEQVWEAAGGTVRYVTLAPELPGATQFIERLTALGVHVSAGHTDALAHEMQDAYAAGLKGVTHLFNAMRGVHHREAGVAGWSLAHGPSWAELIGDGVHVNPTVMRLAIRAKGAERVAIITDAGAFTGLPNGLYHEGYRTVSVLDGVCTLDDGTLAESMSPMNRNCMVLLNHVGATWEQVATMTSLVPATMLGLADSRGSLEAGKDADLTVLNAQGEVLLTAVRGRVVYRREE